jgi:CheY-like chemotaxis protein
MRNTNPTLLVVDDEALNREIIAEYLDGEAYDIVNADRAERARALLNESPDRFDAVLLDQSMPGMDGMTLLGILKADPRFKTLPIIMQTAAAAPELVARGLELGAFYYLTKPYERSALRKVVQLAVEGRNESRNIAERVQVFTASMPLLVTAKFRFRTIDEGRHLATLIAACCPKPELVAIGLTELLINAVEHGNLDIGYDEKSQLQQQNLWLHEVERRLALPEYAGKSVEVSFERTGKTLRITIKDEGRGFDFRRFLKTAQERAFDMHGRGIAIARQMSFSNLEFLGAGNEVVATLLD